MEASSLINGGKGTQEKIFELTCSTLLFQITGEGLAGLKLKMVAVKTTFPSWPSRQSVAAQSARLGGHPVRSANLRTVTVASVWQRCVCIYLIIFTPAYFIVTWTHSLLQYFIFLWLLQLITSLHCTLSSASSCLITISYEPFSMKSWTFLLDYHFS